MAIQPLMTKERYDEFMGIVDHYENDPGNIGSSAYPFVPVSGTGGDLPYRFLIIGQAPRDWGDDVHGKFEGSASEAGKALQEQLVRPNGAFWVFVSKFISRTLNLLGHQCEATDIYKYVAWSNLAKICENRGNPSPKLLKLQAELCVRQLAYETQQYRPHVILVATGNWGDNEVLYPVFGREWPHLPGNIHVQSATVSVGNDGKVPAIWVNHPRNLAERGITHDDILNLTTKIAADALITASL
jgi:hypothetical protein